MPTFKRVVEEEQDITILINYTITIIITSYIIITQQPLLAHSRHINTTTR